MTDISKNQFFRPSVIYIILMMAVVLSISILASVPPVSRDALIHHLAIPKLYLNHGGMYEIPEFEFSYYPMNLDLLYMIPLYVKNDILPKFIHFAFALFTMGMLFSYLKKRINTEYALLGSLLFISIPVIIYQSTIVYVDLGLVCFLFAAMICLFKWIEHNFRLKYLLLSALFCGLALGTKYNGLIGLFLLGLFIPFIYSRYHAHQSGHAARAIGYSAFFVAVALIVFSPWMIRNIIWTGNPVYPLYNNVFNPDDALLDANNDEDESEKHPSMNHLQIRRDIYGESGWEIALIPLRVFFQGRDNDPKYFDGRSNPFLLLLPIFAFMGIASNTRQVKTEKYILLCFSALFLLYACVRTVIRIRYFAPIFPPLVILSMYGLHYIQHELTGKKINLSSLSKQIIFAIIIFFMLAWNAVYIVERFHYAQPLEYLTGNITRDDYIQKFCPEYATMQYANNHLSANDRILGVYTGRRGYYLDVDVVFSLELLQTLAAEAVEPLDIALNLKEKGITHLLINYELFNYWVQNYSLHEKKMLKDFFEKFTVTEFSKDKNGLRRIMVDRL